MPLKISVEIGRWLFTSSFELDLKIGITLAVFKHDGNLPFDTDPLNNFARCDETVSATNLNAYEGISSIGDFLELKERIVLFFHMRLSQKKTMTLMFYWCAAKVMMM